MAKARLRRSFISAIMEVFKDHGYVREDGEGEAPEEFYIGHYDSEEIWDSDDHHFATVCLNSPRFSPHRPPTEIRGRT